MHILLWWLWVAEMVWYKQNYQWLLFFRVL